MKTFQTVVIALISVISVGSYAQTGDVRDYGRFKSSRTPQNYDSLLMQLHTRNAQESYERFYNEFINVNPSSVDLSGALSDEIYEKRLKQMATEIQLPYNKIVKSYIQIYTRPSNIENLMGRAQYYFPIFEEALYRHNLPMELKMLPVIESALIAKARSRVAATGLWQFMAPTGKSYGLEINSFVDERSDPMKSTEAACAYLKDLYNIYDDWTLALAAYNCGPGRVNKALARAGGAKSFWDIYEYLPRETRGYIPAFIAASYAYTYHKAHNITPRPIAHPLATDTIMIDRMLHFQQISSTLDISLEVLQDLNPQYRIDIIPALTGRYPLVLPQAEISKFIDNQEVIYEKDTLYLAKYLKVNNFNEAVKVASSSGVRPVAGSGSQVTYKIKSGDTLGAIARRHGVKVADIQRWNGLKGTNIRAGRTLKIYK